MTKAEQFFYDHAGFSYDPKTETEEQGHERCARELAKAESWASAEGYRVEWREDPEGCIGCDCGSEDCACSTGEYHEVLVAILYDAEGAAVASLGSICGPTRDYRRVVEAELTYQTMHAVCPT